MNDLRITLVQTEIEWKNPIANLSHFDELFDGIKDTDLIVLPEMFTTGFSVKTNDLFEEMNGATVSWMKKKSAEKQAAIVGTTIIKEDDKIYNRCLFVSPNGNVSYYDKRHLFSMGEENSCFSAGKEKLVVEYKGWRICPLICYDLRFPVWSRNIENYDLLIYMANWPSPRHHVWKTLLTARAIENQTYCIGVNRIGSDGAGLKYLGDSAMVDPKGYATFLGSSNESKTFSLSKSELIKFRQSFPLLNDKDHFEIIK